MMKPINILHLSYLSIWNLGQNKGRVSIFLPLKAFVDRGHNVKFMTNDKGQKKGNIEGIEVEHVCTYFSPIRRRYIQNLSRFIFLPITTCCYIFKVYFSRKKFYPQVIYAHTPDVALAAYILSKLLQAKYVLRLYGINKLKKKTIFHKILHFDFYLAFRLRADLYILTNDGTSAKEAAISYGVSETKIHFLKNGLDKEISSKPIDYSLKETIAPNNEKILVSVSRLEKWKQVDLIIRLVPELIKFNCNIKLVIVGDGNEFDNLNELANALGVQKHIYFTGAIEQTRVIDYVKVSDLFISMNALSSMSNPVFEAMICKTAVLALNTGKTEDLIKNNETGFLVGLDQMDSLPNLINEILKDDKRRNWVAENAQKYMFNEWPSWEERVKYEVDLIENYVYNK